jgi:hypothetical protein
VETFWRVRQQLTIRLDEELGEVAAELCPQVVADLRTSG